MLIPSLQWSSTHKKYNRGDGQCEILLREQIRKSRELLDLKKDTVFKYGGGYNQENLCVILVEISGINLLRI